MCRLITTASFLRLLEQLELLSFHNCQLAGRKDNHSSCSSSRRNDAVVINRHILVVVGVTDLGVVLHPKWGHPLRSNRKGVFCLGGGRGDRTVYERDRTQGL